MENRNDFLFVIDWDDYRDHQRAPCRFLDSMRLVRVASVRPILPFRVVRIRFARLEFSTSILLELRRPRNVPGYAAIPPRSDCLEARPVTRHCPLTESIGLRENRTRRGCHATDRGMTPGSQ